MATQAERIKALESQVAALQRRVAALERATNPRPYSTAYSTAYGGDDE